MPLSGPGKRNQGLHQGKLVGRVTTPSDSLHADVAGPIVPMGISKAKYVLVVVDECTRYSWVFPMREKAHEVYTVLYDVYRGNTVVAGLIRGRCTTNTQRVAETIFVAEDSPFVDTAPHLKNTPPQINTSIVFPAA